MLIKPHARDLPFDDATVRVLVELEPLTFYLTKSEEKQKKIELKKELLETIRYEDNKMILNENFDPRKPMIFKKKKIENVS